MKLKTCWLPLALILLPLPTSSTQLQDYFAAETRKLQTNCLAGIRTASDWHSRKQEYRNQLFEMLSLQPLPPKTELSPVITGRLEKENFTVEKLHFQSLPGLYVTANLYLPKVFSGKLPTILYLCGHGNVISNGISYGSKVAYQHHPAWFARNGYACLVLDTLQLGEIQGIHHGTHREKMWWWNARGYTPAGVEAWNSLRALDYLSTRPEVDTNRFGVTGRSGGGAYSWWIAALDERIKVAAPVAGITDLQDHVVKGVVEGHCDCMFFINTYQWDYPLVAALVAPRPLLLANTDKDPIFPLQGVFRTHQTIARIYDLLGASDNLGLLITEGPHKDTQDLQIPVFRWFNRFLKNQTELVDLTAVRFFDPHELKVFAQLPQQEINTQIHHHFISAAKGDLPGTKSEWAQLKQRTLENLNQKVFQAWPSSPTAVLQEFTTVAGQQGRTLKIGKFNSQDHVRLPVYLLEPSEKAPTSIQLLVADEFIWPQLAAWLNKTFALTLSAPPPGPEKSPLLSVFNTQDALVLILLPRGIGDMELSANTRKATHLHRRYMLLGQTLDSMRVYDIQRAVHLIHEYPRAGNQPIEIHASGSMAVNALYAALYQQSIHKLNLHHLPGSHMDGPDYLNVLRFTDIPQVLAMVAEDRETLLFRPHAEVSHFNSALAEKLGISTRIKLSSE